VYCNLRSRGFLLRFIYFLRYSATGCTNQELRYYDVYGVTIDGFSIDDWIHWTFWYGAWLHFTVHCYTLVSKFMSTLSLLDNGFQLQGFSFLWIPDITGLEYQFPTATAHDEWAAVVLYSHRYSIVMLVSVGVTTWSVLSHCLATDIYTGLTILP
jgi:hypothetical protein